MVREQQPVWLDYKEKTFTLTRVWRWKQHPFGGLSKVNLGDIYIFDTNTVPVTRGLSTATVLETSQQKKSDIIKYCLLLYNECQMYLRNCWLNLGNMQQHWLEMLSSISYLCRCWMKAHTEHWTGGVLKFVEVAAAADVVDISLKPEASVL